jgi:O-succinylhomoserine sulfhydrylase
MCFLEKTEAGIAFATGMSAVFAGFGALLKSGDHIIAARSLFGSTHQLLTKVLSKWGITFTYVDGEDKTEWENAVTGSTKIIFIETPSNPGLQLIDIKWLGEFKTRHNLIFSVDNTFATPVLQNPADFGADLVIHSATKYIDGQGRVLGGVITGKTELIQEVKFFVRHTGPSLSPFNAWVLSKSLETLPLRIEKHSDNAYKLALALEDNEELEHVRYPFLPSHPQYEIAKRQMSAGGGIVTFTVKGGYTRAKNFIDSLEMISRSANLGDSRSIATHPASTTHSKLTEEERLAVGITPGLIRISAGLENIADIINDICHALEASKENINKAL